MPPAGGGVKRRFVAEVDIVLSARSAVTSYVSRWFGGVRWLTRDERARDGHLPSFRRAEQTMGMPAAVPRRWTLAEVRSLIAANPGPAPRYELVGGQLLVTPSPVGPHQKAVRELVIELGSYVRGTPVGEALVSPFDVELEPETIVQPDVFVVPPDEGRRLEREMPARSLLLAIEIISPSSAFGDRGLKRELYQRHVPEYWIVDLDAALIERWRPGDERPEILRDRIEWNPAGSSSAFVLELPLFFAAVTGRGAIPGA